MKKPLFFSLGAALAAWSLMQTTLSAATIVDWDGTGSYTGTFQSQGSLGGTAYGVAFDDTNPQVSGSTGTSSVFYGGMTHLNSSSGAYNYQAPGAMAGAFTTGIHARLNGLATADAAFLAYWKAADFLVEPGTAAIIDSSSTMRIAFDSLSSTNLQARLVLETAAGFYITQFAVAAINSTQGINQTVSNIDGLAWLNYDPSSDIIALGSAATPDLTDVVGVGFQLRALDGLNFRTRVGEFEVNATVVPEPTTAAALIFAGGLFALRRRQASQK